MNIFPRSAIIRDSIVRSPNVNFFIEKGFLIAEGLFSVKETGEIRKEVIEIFRGNRGKVEGIAPVTRDADDTEVLSNYNAIHFPHKMSSVILKYVKHARIARILKTIVSPNVKCMQSMLFVKAPGKPGQSWHQDEYYIPTRDRSLTGAWIAIDDASIENGCLWVIPGSQVDGYIRKIIPHPNDEYSEQYCCDLIPYLEEDAKPVEVKSGSVVFFNGYLLHRSKRNKTSDKFRMSLVSHYMSAESLLPWNWDGRLERNDDMRDIVMITGQDPYSYKGIENLTYPFLRQENKQFKEPPKTDPIR